MCKLHLEKGLYNCDLGQELEALAASWQLGGLKLALKNVQDAYAALENSVNVRIVLEAMALKIDQVYKE